ncbi:hypothetical protein [Oceanobacillus oncorhynchi]|uniref:hypothetical protein n=1 Tax=Oceanobacillus oncorhynchi TaxID=545501 RepID=UPI0011DD84B8|nr:hypothetical protein [Oceanobacillus oncorhynchi]
MNLFKWKKPSVNSVNFVNDRWLKWKLAYNGIDDLIDNIMSDLKSAVMDVPYRNTGDFSVIFRAAGTLYEVQYQLFNEKGTRCVEITKAEPVDMKDDIMLNRIKKAINDSKSKNQQK